MIDVCQRQPAAPQFIRWDCSLCEGGSGFSCVHLWVCQSPRLHMFANCPPIKKTFKSRVPFFFWVGTKFDKPARLRPGGGQLGAGPGGV